MTHILQHIYKELSHIKISDIFNVCNINNDSDEILFVRATDSANGGIRENLRTNNLVDQNIYNRCYSNIKNPIFTWLDFVGDNVINCPLGFMSPENIQQQHSYYEDYDAINQYYNRIFWSGNKTHSIRNTIIDYFKSKSYINTHIDIDYWKLDDQYSVYEKNKPKPPPSEYIYYFNKLKASDLFLIIRGDKPWTNSFFDCLRANTIPVCIDTFYGKLGWENIGFQTEDILLDINTNFMSLEEIYETIISLVKNKEKILYMKNNLHKFYSAYILTDRSIRNHGLKYRMFAGWGDFYCAKILEIYNNNYKVLNNQFISSYIKDIKYAWGT